MRVRCSPHGVIFAARARFRAHARRAAADEGGFTITESVTGLAVLFIVILALIASITVAVRGILTGRQRSTALAVAEELMEEVRAADYDRIGHSIGSSLDPTLTAGCASPGSAATDVWYDSGTGGYRYDDPTTAAQDGETLVDGGTYAVVGGTNAPIGNHCTTGTLDATPYEAWIYITAVTAAIGDPHKRVTVIVEFSNEQYAKTAVENRAKISSLVSRSSVADAARITALADTTAGTATLAGDPGGAFNSFQATFPKARGTIRSNFVDELTGNVTSAWAQVDGGSADASATGGCTDGGTVATCPSVSVTTANDDNTSSVADEYDLNTATGPVGSLGAGPVGAIPWEGGTASSQESACHGVGFVSGVDCGAAFGGAADGLPRGVHTGSGPEDLSVPMSIDVPELDEPATVSGTWLGFTGAFQAAGDLEQNVLSADKQTTPTASADAPAMNLVTINDPVGVLAPLTIVSVGSVSVDAAAPVGNLMGNADVSAAAVTFTVAGNPLAIPTTTPGSGDTHSVAPVTAPLGILDVTYSVTVRTGTAVEQQTRDGSTVTNSKAELTEILVVTVDVEIVVCGSSLDLLCTGVTPTTVADATVTINYGGVLAEATHKDTP